MFKKLFIGNLAKSVITEDLENLFKKYGNISTCKVIKDKNFGFVEYDDPHDAKYAMEDLDGYQLQGLRLHIQIAKSENSMDNNNNSERRNKGYDNYDQR
jgi:RNA recognition motif-containing protein